MRCQKNKFYFSKLFPRKSKKSKNQWEFFIENFDFFHFWGKLTKFWENFVFFSEILSEKYFWKSFEKNLRYYIDVKIRARSIGAIFRAIAALLPTKRELFKKCSKNDHFQVSKFIIVITNYSFRGYVVLRYHQKPQKWTFQKT